MPGFLVQEALESCIELVHESQLRAAWPRAEGEPIIDRRDERGRLFLAIDRHDRLGFRIDAPAHGLCVVSPDGARIASSIGRRGVGAWLRLLYAQVLPLTATLLGREVLHASAVAWQGHAVALVGPPGAGKSSVCAHLVGRGATFLTDDALALSHGDDAILAHPGPRFASVPAHELDTLDRAARERLGPTLGVSDKPHVAPEGAHEPVTLGWLCALEPSPDATARIERVNLDAGRLLGSSFVAYVGDPGRLERQLDLAATLARTAPALRVVAPSGGDPGRLADLLLEHVASDPPTSGSDQTVG